MLKYVLTEIYFQINRCKYLGPYYLDVVAERLATVFDYLDKVKILVVWGVLHLNVFMIEVKRSGFRYFYVSTKSNRWPISACWLQPRLIRAIGFDDEKKSKIMVCIRACGKKLGFFLRKCYFFPIRYFKRLRIVRTQDGCYPKEKSLISLRWWPFLTVHKGSCLYQNRTFLKHICR